MRSNPAGGTSLWNCVNSVYPTLTLSFFVSDTDTDSDTDSVFLF